MRVDFFASRTQSFFAELTFTPFACYPGFVPKSLDKLLGHAISDAGAAATAARGALTSACLHATLRRQCSSKRRAPRGGGGGGGAGDGGSGGGGGILPRAPEQARAWLRAPRRAGGPPLAAAGRRLGAGADDVEERLSELTQAARHDAGALGRAGSHAVLAQLQEAGGAWVINRGVDRARLAAFEAGATSARLTARVFEAVDKTSLDRRALEADGLLAKGARLPRAGSLACALSHIRLVRPPRARAPDGAVDRA